MKVIYTLISFLILQSLASAQSFYDETVIQTIEISFLQSNWDALLDAEKAGDENYIMAQSVTINGIVFDSVGVKYKGNSTYNSNYVKNPFHIELDTYKEHDYQGYKDIKLSNVANDPSFVREVLSYNILRKYMHAPKSNYANVYVNGNLIGLYSNSESVSKAFLDDRFSDKNNTFIKCNPPSGAGPGTTTLPNLVYLGTDSASYYAGYELKSDYGWKQLIDFCDTLSNHIEVIESILDVDRALYMIAYDNALVNLDSYIGAFSQNYYLYKDDYNKFLPVVWDLNESFGRFSSTGTSNLNNTTAKQQMSHLLHLNDAAFPLIRKLLNVPLYKRMYLAHYKTILEENFSNGSFLTTGQAYQDLISTAVQNDQNKFYTYANFTTNLNSDINGGGGPGGGSSTPGIGNLMTGRASYLLNLSDFTQTQPTISNVQASSSEISLNDNFYITADITNETQVYLGYRNAAPAHFQRVLMYDDGAHNDGAANDGLYGVNLTMESISFEYYIYADNDNIGLFSPARAEHEFYTITSSVPVVGDLVINEFQASNSTTMPDQDGDFDDWVELYNNSNSTISLETMYLSDDAANLQKWQFPSGAVIPAGSYYIIWADNDISQSGVHASFSLSANGEQLFLSQGTNEIIDQVVFGTQGTDKSYGRFPNGTGDFQILEPTFNAQNSLVASVHSISADGSQITAYPNPTSDLLTIELSNADNESKSLRVYSIYGNLIVDDFIQQKKQLSTSNWAPGIYLINIDNQTFRVIKAN
jgi:hypothetical protein